MSKGARLRATGGRRDWERRLRGEEPSSSVSAGVGRPRGAARARVRSLGRGNEEKPVNPWQGYGNAITIGRSKIARWKTGRIKSEVGQLDSYMAGLKESGIVKTLDDVVNVRERDDRERHLK